MEYLRKRTASLLLLWAFAGLLLLNGCTKGKELVPVTGATYVIKGNADGIQMVPASSTIATGNFDGWFDEQLNVLTFTLSWTGIGTSAVKDPITSINFYGPASSGATGTLIHTIKFSNNNVAGSTTMALSGYNELLPAERDAMYGGKLYYVICTVSAPNGLIRGQLTATKK